LEDVVELVDIAVVVVVSVSVEIDVVTITVVKVVGTEVVKVVTSVS
jgi:hypothetical protein